MVGGLHAMGGDPPQSGLSPEWGGTALISIVLPNADPPSNFSPQGAHGVNKGLERAKPADISATE